MKNMFVLFFGMLVAVMTSGCVMYKSNNTEGNVGFWGIPKNGLGLVAGARGRSSLPDVAKKHEFIFQTPTTDIHHSEGGELNYNANLTPFGWRERTSTREWNNTTIEKNPPDPWRYFYPPQ